MCLIVWGRDFKNAHYHVKWEGLGTMARGKAALTFRDPKPNTTLNKAGICKAAMFINHICIRVIPIQCRVMQSPPAVVLHTISIHMHGLK